MARPYSTDPLIISHNWKKWMKLPLSVLQNLGGFSLESSCFSFFGEFPGFFRIGRLGFSRLSYDHGCGAGVINW